MIDYTLGFTPNTERMLKKFKADIRILDKAVKRAAQKEADYLEVITKQNLSNDVLDVRSGALRRSVKGRVLGDRDNIRIGIGSVKGASSPYSAFLEHGGKRGGFIYPVTKQWLTIPQAPALTAAGVPRYASARDVPVRLRFIPSSKDSNTAVLVEDTLSLTKKGSRASKTTGRIWYVLKKKVFVLPAKWLSRSLDEGAAGIHRRMTRVIIAHIKGSKSNG